MDLNDDSHIHDVGRYVGRSSVLSVKEKLEFLNETWTPPRNYDFAADATHLKRKFNHEWLDIYSPWLVYSKRLKGAFCKFCVIFPPRQGSVRGTLGALMIRPFTRYKDIHAVCKEHTNNHWHKAASESARMFMTSNPVDIQLNEFASKTLEENRKIMSSIISCIVFSGTHDLPLRGKFHGEGVFEDLCKLRIDSGDKILEDHFQFGAKNASYRSVRIQNEIIDICGNVVRQEIIEKVKKATCYAILADETADISGMEQLSIGLRYYDEKAGKINEDFTGFVQLDALDAQSIATAIDKFVTNQELDPSKCVGLGFDGCSTMSGKEAGVQAILKKKYKSSLYFHCASHRLNLVVNDVNILPEVRNTIGTIKDIVNFFRESVLRRKMIPNIPRLCETRWSEKYKVIRLFKNNFLEIIQALESLSVEGNPDTRKRAYQLHSAACKPAFIMAVVLIAKYSEFLEPVVNSLQSIQMNILEASEHIQRIVKTFKSHREEAEKNTDSIYQEAKTIAQDLGLQMTVPRVVPRQQHRSNHPAESHSEFWRRSMVVPYLDSIVSSLQIRFSEDNIPAYSLIFLHPLYMLKMGLNGLKTKIKPMGDFYKISRIETELELWFQLWKNKQVPAEDLQSIEVADLLSESQLFFPSVKKALEILITLPCTTCTVERSFSSLRRIKTWLRSTMAEDRLNGLALLSIHRKEVMLNEKVFIKKVLDKFALDPRKLLLKN